MAIKFKLIEKGEPGIVGGGQKKQYASAILDEEFTIDEMVREIEKFSTLTEVEVRGVIIALEHVMKRAIQDGKIIRLDMLGSFYPVISSNGVPMGKRFTTDDIRSVKLYYRPGKRISSLLTQVAYKKVE